MIRPHLSPASAFCFVEGMTALLFAVVVLLWPSLTLSTFVTITAIFLILWGGESMYGGLVLKDTRATYKVMLVFGLLAMLLGLYFLSNTRIPVDFFMIFLGLIVVARGTHDMLAAFIEDTDTLTRVIWAILGWTGVIAGTLLLNYPITEDASIGQLASAYAIIFSLLIFGVGLEEQARMKYLDTE